MFGYSITPNIDRAGFRVALKTGTSDIDKKPKDIWTVAYTPQLSMSVWLGNPDTSPLTNGNSSIPAKVLDPVLAFALQQYKDAGKDMSWFTAPSGIQTIRGEVYPSYYNKSTGISNATMTFDKVSKKKATDCTPSGAKVDIGVTKTTDPYTKKDVISAPDGYDPNDDDDVHTCGDTPPSVSLSISGTVANVSYTAGRYALQTIELRVGDTVIASKSVSSSDNWQVSLAGVPTGTITALVTDTAYYTDSDSKSYSGH